MADTIGGEVGRDLACYRQPRVPLPIGTPWPSVDIHDRVNRVADHVAKTWFQGAYVVIHSSVCRGILSKVIYWVISTQASHSDVILAGSVPTVPPQNHPN